MKRASEKRAEATSKQLTREQLDKKMQRASEKRAEAINKQKTHATEFVEKVTLTRERRTSQERANDEKLAAELSAKLQIADQKRSVQLSSIQEKAHEYNERVSKRVKMNEAKHQTESSSKKLELEEKLKKATERHDAQIESVKQTAALSAQHKLTASPQKTEASKSDSL